MKTIRLISSRAATAALSALFAAAVPGCDAQSEAPRGSPSGAARFESRAVPQPVWFLGYYPHKPNGAPERWQMENRDGFAVVDGDIVLGTIDQLSDRNSSKSLQYTRANLWPKAVVPYELDPAFPNRAVVLAAFEEFHQNTKIKFVRRTTEPDYVVFTTTQNASIGGQSFYGRQGMAQSLWLNQSTDAWNKGVVIHELCHALGVAHEQCRADRDRYVRVEYANILPGYDTQFTQLFGQGRDVKAYDYASIMHYPSWAFSVNGRATLVPLQPGVDIGQREKLSGGDIAGLAAIYEDELRTP